MQLYWHRRNLQPAPNPALATALDAADAAESGVVPIFVLDDAILSRADGLGVAFMLNSLRTLRDWYRDHGSDLVIQHGDPTEIVGQVAERIGARRVVWNSDHSRLARERDRAVRRALTHSDIDHTSVPSEQVTGRRAATPPVSEPAAQLASPTTFDIETRAVPQLSELADTGYDATPLTAGTEAARKRLQALSNGTTYRRCDDRDIALSRQAARRNWG